MDDTERDKRGRLKLILTCSALLVAFVHLLFPSVKIDFVTLALLIVAALPWLSPLLKSVELPGGFKIELQDLKDAAETIIGTSTAEPSTAEEGLRVEVGSEADVFREGPGVDARMQGPGVDRRVPGGLPREAGVVASLRSIAGTDPNLALVGFRIEIEKRIRELARRQGYKAAWSVNMLIRELRKKEILPDDVASALEDLIGLGNQAAHGRPVEPEAAAWVLDHGPEVLAALDRLLEAGP